MAIPLIISGLVDHRLLNGDASEEQGGVSGTPIGSFAWPANVPANIAGVVSKSWEGTSGNSAAAGRFDIPGGSYTPVGAGDWSVSSWFAHNAASGVNRLWLHQGYTGVDAGNFGVGINNNKAVVRMWPVGGTEASYSISTSQGDMTIVGAPWRHIVFSRVEATGAITVYINGVSEGSVVGATGDCSSATATKALRIGQHRDEFPFQGLLSDHRLYSRALSAAEALQIYNGDYGSGLTGKSKKVAQQLAMMGR